MPPNDKREQNRNGNQRNQGRTEQALNRAATDGNSGLSSTWSKVQRHRQAYWEKSNHRIKRSEAASIGTTTVEERYFISSLPLDIDLVSKAIRKHWMVESYHWHLDVTFKEDTNRTVDKDAAYNLNIIRKITLHILKLLSVSKATVSLKAKRFMICMNSEKYIDMVMQL